MTGSRNPRGSQPEEFAEELRRARAGEAGALDSLLRRVLPQLDRHARGLLGGWLAGRLGTSDIVQEALIEVVRSIDRFVGDSEAAFVSWLQRIVDRAALQQHRRFKAGKRRPPSGSSGLRELAGVLLPPSVTPSADLRSAEFLELCARALSELTVDQRLAVERVLIERRPTADVAAELGRSTDALHALLGRARARLAMRLEQLGAYGPDRSA